jgi:hypothetical protein
MYEAEKWKRKKKKTNSYEMPVRIKKMQKMQKN